MVAVAGAGVAWATIEPEITAVEVESDGAPLVEFGAKSTCVPVSFTLTEDVTKGAALAVVAATDDMTPAASARTVTAARRFLIEIVFTIFLSD